LYGFYPVGPNWEGQYESRNVCISSRFSNLLQYVSEVFPEEPLDFIGASCDILFFIFSFVDLGLLFLFRSYLSQDLPILFIFLINIMFHQFFL
jgi:hypothetical protein